MAKVKAKRAREKGKRLRRQDVGDVGGGISKQIALKVEELPQQQHGILGSRDNILLRNKRGMLGNLKERD